MKSLFKKIITTILFLEARLILKKYKPTIIAITGSVGKTSTKDAIYSVLSGTSSHVRKSQKSFNSEIGVPLTIIGCDNAWNNPMLWLKNIFEGLEIIFFKTDYPDCLILEVGADHKGDIERITKWLKPDVVVVTKISKVPVHVEFFASPEEVLLEKSYLVKALKSDGTLILSYDDESVRALSEGMPQKLLTYGMDPAATVQASNESIIYEESNGRKIPVGIAFKLNYAGNSVPITVKGVLGIQQIYPLIAAAAVAISRKVLLTDIIQSLGRHVPPRGRMNIIAGINDSLIIDDTYNSSPDALREALFVLQKIYTTGRKIAVMGDMMELGKFSAEEHKKAGDLASQAADIIITVGQRSAVILEGLDKNIKETAIPFNTSSEAGEYLRGIVKRGDIILVKGSQSIRMERIVKDLLLAPENASELLVRQETEWLAKK